MEAAYDAYIQTLVSRAIETLKNIQNGETDHKKKRMLFETLKEKIQEFHDARELIEIFHENLLDIEQAAKEEQEQESLGKYNHENTGPDKHLEDQQDARNKSYSEETWTQCQYGITKQEDKPKQDLMTI